jgi:hypothetical protein
MTKYLGGNRYESTCVKCRETVVWEDGDNVGMVFFQDHDIGLLCPSCYNWTKGAHVHQPSKCASD